MAENKDEQLTDEELAQLQLAEENENVVDLEAKGALKAGDTIWFKFEKNATHLFDKVSGKNLI